MTGWLLPAAVLGVAVLYAAVGHAGATGYIAVMGLMGLAPEVIRPTALVLNLVVAAIGTAQGVIVWTVTAFFDGIFGLILGVGLIPVATRVIGPAIAAITKKKKAAH